GRRDLNPGRRRGSSQVSLSGDIQGLVSEFEEYCIVVQRLAKSVRRDYRCIAKRSLRLTKGVVSYESVKGYLATYLSKAPRAYNNQLKGLRAFIGKFLERPDIIERFKKAHVPYYEPDVPTDEQVKQGFYGLTDDIEKALYLFYATSGVRKSEALNLNMNTDVDFELRCVKSKHDTRSKKAGITFYNGECEKYLKGYMNSRRHTSDLLFVIGSKRFKRMWNKASEKAGFRITAQALRIWHSTTLGELMVPDRYVDVFHGRAPRSVLAKYYTSKETQKVKRIYDKADLKVLG
ncbi:MAG: integrase, partial [Candidatus Bathyarchaeota archaeon]|nr:integrase [Candidatus Bathyarchaeota archaeon]